MPEATMNVPTTTLEITPEQVQVHGQRLVVEVIDPSEKSIGGIILPASSQGDKEVMLATVVGVGDGRITDFGVHLSVRQKKDDVVIIGKHAGTRFGNNDKYRIINDVEVLATVSVEGATAVD